MTGAPERCVGDACYGEYYFQHCGGGPGYKRDRSWLEFFGTVADRIVSDIGPRRVLDAGCAFGFLVESLRARGIDASGIDLSTFAIGKVHPTIRDSCRQGSIADDFPDSYDLIVSIEVVEHMGEADAMRAIRNMCSHTEDILFSSSPIDHEEVTHVNVHPPEYWVTDSLYSHW